MATEINESLQWYKSLNMNQRMSLRELSLAICGMAWNDFNVLFTPQERLDILHQKLKFEGIL